MSRPRAVTVTPGATPESLFGASFPAAGSGGTQDLTGAGDNTLYLMATGIQVAVAGTVSAVRYFVPTTNQPTNPDFTVGLFRADPTGGLVSGAVLLTQQAATAPTAGAAGTWASFTLAAPQSVSAGQILYPTVRTNRYAVATLVFAGPVVSGNLTGIQAAGPNFPNGGYNQTGAATDPLQEPNQGSGSPCYGVDLVFTAA